MHTESADLRYPRAEAAEAAHRARSAEVRIAALQARPPGGADDGGRAESELAELMELLPGLKAAERRLAEQVQAAQAQADSFRVRKETLKASYTAAEALIAVSDLLTEAGQEKGGRRGDAEASAEPEASLLNIVSQVEREFGLLPAEGLMELRIDQPDSDRISILFAFEPADTALLLAVAEGEGERAEAVGVASDVLRAVRAGGDPDASAVAFDDPVSFLERFFPGSAVEVEVGAAALAARNRGRALAEQRARLGLSQAQVARRMGVRQERVSAIERAAPGATEIRTLTAYVEALGGRLEILADFGDERVRLR